MIPYLLWLCHRRKGSSSKYGTRSQLKSCKMNTTGHEESIKNTFFCVEIWQFCSQLISSSTAWGWAWGCGARRWCRHLGRPPNTEPWRPLIMSLKSINIDEIKIPVIISLKIHQIKPLPLHLFMSLLWLMWWTFFEIKWFESSFYMPIHVCQFVCCLFACAHVCLNPC